MPFETSNLYRSGVERDFNTAVHNITIVAIRSSQSRRTITRSTHERRQYELHKHISRLLLIQIYNQVQAVIEEIDIKTEVKLLLRFPLNIQVLQVSRTIRSTKTGVHYAHGRTPLITTNIGVTRLSPTETKFTVGNNALIANVIHESFLRPTPSGCYRVETCPTTVRTEVRATIITECIGQEIAIIVVIGFARKERSHCRATEAAANLRVVLTQGRILNRVVGKIRIRCAYIIPFALPALLTNHGSNAVLTKMTGIRDVVLYSPIGAAVLLNAGFVLILAGGTKAVSRLKGFCPVPAEVPTQFRMPDKALVVSRKLEESNVEEQVTIQFLTSQLILVHLSESYRVRIRETFFRYGREAAIYIVNLNIRRRDERVHDKTFFRICFLQVFTRIRIRNVYAHLEPLLQLSIDIGAKRITLEVRALNRTFLVHITTTYVIANLIRTTLSRNLMLVLKSRAEDCVLPVRTCTQYRRIRISYIRIADFALVYHIVVVLSKLAEVKHVQTICLVCPTYRTIIRELGFTCLTTLGSNQDNTISTLSTINSGSGCIFKNFHRNDVSRVDGRERRNGRNLTITELITQTIVGT